MHESAGELKSAFANIKELLDTLKTAGAPVQNWMDPSLPYRWLLDTETHKSWEKTPGIRTLEAIGSLATVNEPQTNKHFNDSSNKTRDKRHVAAISTTPCSTHIAIHCISIIEQCTMNNFFLYMLLPLGFSFQDIHKNILIFIWNQVHLCWSFPRYRYRFGARFRGGGGGRALRVDGSSQTHECSWKHPLRSKKQCFSTKLSSSLTSFKT